MQVIHSPQLIMKTPDHSYFPFLSSENDYEIAVSAIRKHTAEYIHKNQINSLILGISGGIDSALCAALLRPVCEKIGIPLIGRSITIETNKQDEIDRSIQIGSLFCHDFSHLDLTDIFLVNKKLLIHYDDSMLSKLRQGNMKARMRMMVLYDLAQLHKGMVISTDNFTEYLTGFWTLHGDVGDFAPIMNLWKTEVFNMSKYLLSFTSQDQYKALDSCILATPVDGLGISNNDCDQLGVSNYYEGDQIFASYFKGDPSFENHPIVQRFKKSHYKRENPVSIPRTSII